MFLGKLQAVDGDLGVPTAHKYGELRSGHHH